MLIKCMLTRFYVVHKHKHKKYVKCKKLPSQFETCPKLAFLSHLSDPYHLAVPGNSNQCTLNHVFKII